MNWLTLDDIALADKRVLVRVDINVPMEDGLVSDVTRIQKIAPTIKEIIAAGGQPILLAHLGRPNGEVDRALSLNQLVPALEQAFACSVIFVADCKGPAAETAIKILRKGQVLLLENTRFYMEEEQNDPEFAKNIAKLGDIFCNDAFSVAHRSHASTETITRYIPSCVGRLMEAELRALEQALGSPQKPVVAIVGGAKVSSKLELLTNLIEKVDYLVIGGGMANTFLAAQGYDIGKSLAEQDMVQIATSVMNKSKSAECKIILPRDIVVASEFNVNAITVTYPLDQCPPDGMILDVGPESIKRISGVLVAAKTLIWNGPLGAFELEPFSKATHATAKIAADLTSRGLLMSVAGGGDTVAALNKSGTKDKFSYVSNAGGAFLEWMEGKTLPAVNALGKK